MSFETKKPFLKSNFGIIKLSNETQILIYNKLLSKVHFICLEKHNVMEIYSNAKDFQKKQAAS
jgi:hypothetical protein